MSKADVSEAHVSEAHVSEASMGEAGIGEAVAADEDSLRLAEALIFASAQPVSLRELGQLLADGAAAETVMAALHKRYAGRGVELVEVAGRFMFRTAPDLAPRLRTVVDAPRSLPRAAMETLAIIAYQQPVTRAEIEATRGASLAQTTLDALLEAALIAPAGHRDAPGRPTLWATAPAFLTRFGLRDLRDLPRREDLLVEPPGAIPAEEDAAAAPPPTEAEEQEQGSESSAPPPLAEGGRGTGTA